MDTIVPMTCTMSWALGIRNVSKNTLHTQDNQHEVTAPMPRTRGIGNSMAPWR
ncbi:uncharacterized protein LACBIDRAFT_308483 [Laccaria bicolor S238N-H82]|uniref:Predicted protein n=1 Tax=Laccaria bicolor (strain S238N-H82 / ATCC MYA-4686) TaxID=486041 RepID=B0CWE8_LACBS|nr:uncharacterized protein LACBIDRAFT_308483 [Laccaria bicolor S238N-H82]EDR13498.1 predicted protein [Laccaria bicolor S238N-H82]|eukprot:XP_001875996.1 predicted protein [Laccaria bicolor S238N-H82]